MIRQGRQAEIAAQRGVFVIRPEYPALLKQRDDLLCEAPELAGVASVDVDPVECAALEPTGDLCGHRLGRSDERAGVLIANEVDRLAQRELPRDRRGSDRFRLREEAVLRMLERRNRESGVEIILAEIMPAECTTEFGEGLLETLVGAAIGALDRSGVVVGIADRDREAGQDNDLVRVATEFGGARFQIGVEGLALFDRFRVREDCVGHCRAEIAPLLGIARLEYHGFALRRALDVERADDREMLALVVERVQLRFVEENTGLAIADQRAVLV